MSPTSLPLWAADDPDLLQPRRVLRIVGGLGDQVDGVAGLTVLARLLRNRRRPGGALEAGGQIDEPVGALRAFLLVDGFDLANLRTGALGRRGVLLLGGCSRGRTAVRAAVLL